MLSVPGGRLFKRFNAADGEVGLGHRLIDHADPFSVQGLDVAVIGQHADGPPYGIAGTVIDRNQGVLRRKQLLVRIFLSFDFLFQTFIDGFEF